MSGFLISDIKTIGSCDRVEILNDFLGKMEWKIEEFKNLRKGNVFKMSEKDRVHYLGNKEFYDTIWFAVSNSFSGDIDGFCEIDVIKVEI